MDKSLFNMMEYPDLSHSAQLKEDFFNRRVDRFKTFGRLRKFKKYRNRFIGGRLVCEERVVDLTKQNLSRIIKREENKPYNYFSALPLPVNDVSRIVGIMKDRPWTPNFKPQYKSDIFLRDILTANSESFREFCNSKTGKVLPGAWRFSCINLVDMCSPALSSFTMDQMIAGVKSRRHLDLVLPKLLDYNRDSILSLGVNPKANPGVNSSKMFGKKRLKSVGVTKRCAYELAGEILGGTQVVDKSLVHIGGREKRNLFSNETKVAKARVTCGQEDVPTLIGQSVVTPINKGLQNLNAGFNWW
jgi:hypothetical protein